MKKHEFAVIGKSLLAVLPGFAVKGPMVFRRPIDQVLAALYFEGSSFDTHSFYVWAFVLPLFVPGDE